MLEHIELSRVLIIDIETVPQYASFEEVPSTYQSLWETKTRFQRKGGETPAEFYVRGGIWAEFGKIVCISAGILRGRGEEMTLRIKSFAGDDESCILQSFSDTFKSMPADVILCAHNGKEFDFPYLSRRMLVNGLNIPLPLAIHGKKPWEVSHIDTLDLWKFGDHKNYTSLELLAGIFGIESPKADMNGSDVHHIYWQEHDLSRIKTYCQNDVITTAQLLLRFKHLPLLDARQIIAV